MRGYFARIRAQLAPTDAALAADLCHFGATQRAARALVRIRPEILELWSGDRPTPSLGRVDLSSLATTALGAVIGVGATVVADRSRWRRDRRDKGLEVKRQVYAEYLAALSRTRNELRVASRNPSVPAAERARLALEAFTVGGAYELRYQVAIVAPPEVVEASTHAFRALRELRDLVESGVTHRDPRYLRRRVEWDSSFAELCRRVREDLDPG